MAERKLLQGGDILGWQYGDVKYIVGGGEGDLVLERAQITRSTDIHIHTHTHKYTHAQTFLHVHTLKQGGYT